MQHQENGPEIRNNGVSAKHWDVEKMIAFNPEVIICSTAAKGYETIKGPAEAANIPVVAVIMKNFQDYLKCRRSLRPGKYSEFLEHPKMTAMETSIFCR